MSDASLGSAAVAAAAPAAPAGPVATPPVTPPPTDHLVTTEHSLRLRRQTLTYTATTGRMVLSEEVTEDGVYQGRKAKAQMSVTSYVVEPKPGEHRPVTFAFNGGPGSSSVWLHLGLLGPRRVDSGDVGALTPPPYGLLDNKETLLAVSDLVFIDPVSTGWSRTTEGGKPKDFHGYQPDVDSVSELIRLWVTRNGRWLSPKFLIGESYGTVRASAVAERLQDHHGMFLNGIMLISSIIDFLTADQDFRNDRASVGFLPTYALTAQRHGLLGRRSASTIRKEVEEFAERDYPWALARGSRLTPTERSAVVAKLSALTGLSTAYLEQCNLRPEHIRFCTELLRDRGLSVGRLDSRFTGPLGSGTAEQFDADPSMDAIHGPYAAAFNHYVRSELNYVEDQAYLLHSSVYETWSFKEFEGKPIDVTGRLSRAMRANPYLQVHVAYGLYDLATPYYAALDSFAHLDVPAALLANVEHRTYEAGHMMYVHEPSRIQQSADLATFVRRASHR